MQTNHTTRLTEALENCRGAGLTTPAELLASPLRQPLMQALHAWAERVPMAASGVLHMLQEMQMATDEAASEWLVALWQPGREDHPCPHIAAMLTTLHQDGAPAVLHRLMTHARSYIAQLYRQHQRSFPPAPDGAAEAAGSTPDPLTHLLTSEALREIRAGLEGFPRRGMHTPDQSSGEGAPSSS